MKLRTKLIFAASLLVALVLPSRGFATHPCTSPLVLDLDGNGRILTSGLETAVEFDINGDGILDEIGWTATDPEEGFLWLDRNRNGRVDDGSELFGSSTRLPSGDFAENGFEALGVYDLPELGGDEDGVISNRDLVWTHLRIWIDRNHDGRSQRHEIRPLAAHGVVWIGLSYEEVNELDGHLNLHAERGRFVTRAHVFGRMHLREQIVDDIYFVSPELLEER